MNLGLPSWLDSRLHSGEMSATGEKSTKRRTRKSATSVPAVRARGGDVDDEGARSSGGPLASGERARESAEQDKLLGVTLAGKYQLEELLGEGAMGRVYRARHVGLEKEVAIKVLHERLSGEERVEKRFHREARAASRLSHPNSVQVLDFGATDEGVLFIAMELLDGEDLQVILDHDSPLSPRRIGSILGQALRALDEAHHVGIIHRDFKPENIVVSVGRGGEDVVKVCDFGIAKILDGEGQSITVDGFVCGTPQYMAPEQARGDAIDRRLDIYAAGVVLYQLLVGAPPFTGDTALGIITKQLTEEPVPPRVRRPELGIPASLEAIALRAMSKARSARFETARQMADALAEAIEALGPLAETRLGSGEFAERARAMERAATLELEPTIEPTAGAQDREAGGARRVGPWHVAFALTLAALVAVLAAQAWSVWGPQAPIDEPSEVVGARTSGEPTLGAAAAEATEPSEAPRTDPSGSPRMDGSSEAGDPSSPRLGSEARSSATERGSRASIPVGSLGAVDRARSPETARAAREGELGSAGSAGSSAGREATPGAAPRDDRRDDRSPAQRAYEEGRAAFVAQDVPRAITLFEEAARLSPRDANVQKQLARAYMRAGDRQRGIAAYRRYLEIEPDAPDRLVVESILAEQAER